MKLDAIRKQPLFYIALLFCVLILIRFQFPEKIPSNDVSLQINRSNAPIFLGGVIISEVDTRDTAYGDELVSFNLKAREISEGEGGNPTRVIGSVRVYLRNPGKTLNYGDEVLMKGWLRSPKGKRNPGGFDQKAYLDRQGIRTLFYGDSHAEPKILNRHQGNYFRERMIELKRFLSGSLSEVFDKRDGAFLKALFLGERSDLDDDFKSLFIKTGTMHILAVSGFNIGFLTLTLYFFLKPFKILRGVKLWLTLILIWGYCSLVGWQSPVVRASVMATVLILGQLLGRKPNILNSLGLAALVILAVSPKQLFDAGFQLSFIAVFAIAEVLPIFLRPLELWPNERMTFKEKIGRQAEELFWISWVCLILTLPVTIQNFYMVAPLSLLANMIVVPLSFFIFFTGTVFFLTFWWVPKILFFVPLAIQWMMRVFVAALFFVENLPGAYFIVGKLSPVLWVCLVMGIVYFLWDRRIKNTYTRAVAVFLFILNVFLVQNLSRELDRKFQMTALDVGQGDAIYFEFPEGGNCLIDAGKGGEGDRGRWVVTPFLKSKGVSALDMLVISHPQEDHIGGMPAVLDEFKVKKVLDGGSFYGSKTFEILRKKIPEEKAEYLHAYLGARVEGFRDVEIRVLNPPRSLAPERNVNNESIVLKIIYHGTSFLLTGDIQEKAMDGILNGGQDVQSDVLKVPHHGGKLGPAGENFVKAVDPKISVISAGEKNAFHQPAEETLRILEAVQGNAIYRTDRDHAIEIVSNGHAVRVIDNHSRW